MIQTMKTFTKKGIVRWLVLELSHFKGDVHVNVNEKGQEINLFLRLTTKSLALHFNNIKCNDERGSISGRGYPNKDFQGS